jgi:hypothetical protein
MRSLDFSIDLILPASACNRNEYTRNLPGVKSGWRVRLTTSEPCVSRLSRENVGASTSHDLMGLHGLLQRYLLLSLVVILMKYVYVGELLESSFCIFSILDVITEFWVPQTETLVKVSFYLLFYMAVKSYLSLRKNKEYYHLIYKDI